MRRGPSKKDANHDTIARTYRDLGCSVFDLHAVGDGMADIVVGCYGTTELVEIKTLDGKLTPAQTNFHANWRGAKRSVRTVDDVCNHVSEMRARQGYAGTYELLRDLARALDRGSVGIELRMRLGRAIDADDRG